MIMKEAIAKLNYIGISPRKIRAVTAALSGKPVKFAQDFLKVVPRSPAREISKLLKSAVSNAKNNLGASSDKLYIKNIRVDVGPTLKRFMPRAFGRAYTIRKRSSHVTIVLGEK
ncbi:MAG: 50S ribosomal protein L22 [Candidatus Giovannonibacteria bacterium GW2011_GWB1_45_9b]|uniref:Large ribosomal subunit protein uL22 n=7 Tax=Candidatus Giovannoniibacteriota TaxID=1752738 RepID=A0A0G1MAW2_9BACT|nr:MAG: 50S ribosomal protein L22 [Candidatus Giovannonibacteria bacterium GW2011_GWC2_44_8]KKU05197.1 MAG: 50S ribosomal protein L22 [Candidatus Giovannonibacteria bacterium GW2011_GWA2_45_21]KKU16727.1 MAG: 50S ribosomal protein L22 [Candidatus Giovannonibacteria bacterium GW2011_GWB1_45_9b]